VSETGPEELKCDSDGTRYTDVSAPSTGATLIGEGQMIDYSVAAEVVADRNGDLIRLAELEAEVKAGQVVALIRPESDSVIKSPASGAVRWSASLLESSKRRHAGETIKDYRVGRGKDRPIFGEVCVPIQAPTLEDLAGGEIRVKERSLHRQEVKKSDVVAQVEIDVPSPASGTLQEVLVPVDSVGHCTLLGRVAQRTPSANSTGFMINLPGQWRHRPGVSTRESESPLRPSRDVTIADREILYTVSHDRYVMAGNFMGTLTRLSTMESANESARHAVNAILRKLANSADSKKYNGAGRLLGDYVKVWNPERHEPPDLDVLKRLDKELFDAKVPHFIDVLRIPEIIERLGLYEKVGDYPVRNLAKLLETSSQSFAKEWSFMPSAIDRNAAVAAIDSVLKSGRGGKEITDWLQKLIETVMKPPARDGRNPADRS
jgi:hypothetical protein